MIKNIQCLKQFGIFQDHAKSEIEDFGRFNLFYGWNGSGKSTLSSLFRCIENSKRSDEFPLAEFTVGIDGRKAITQANITEADLNLHTFNHEFIEENISWNSIVKSILLIDETKISERKSLEKLKKLQERGSDACKKEASGIETLKDTIAKFETVSARHIKTNFQSIDTADLYYMNYDKRKFKKFIDSNVAATKSDDSILGDKKIDELTKAAKPDQKSVITFTKRLINQERLTKVKEHFNDLLKTSVVSQTIQRFVEHGDIGSWVEKGLDLHKHHEVNQCEFCGNAITEERKKQLKAHFNDEYKAFQDRLVRADDWLKGQCIQPLTLPAKSDFYNELQNEYDEARTALDTVITDFNKEIEAWQEILRKKTSNLLEMGLSASAITESSIQAFNKVVTDISTVIDKHNYKSGNFHKEIKKAQRQLELHYATTEIKHFHYYENEKEVVARNAVNSTLERKVKDLGIEIRTREDSLSDEGLGASQFNESLHKFLGRSELTLRFNPKKKGYEILRNNSDLVNGNLSESEKNAIAFVYFIIKLRENENRIEDTIVVIDDPISSFDSSHIYHAYSFMKMHCEKAKQLFVLTHNLTFFMLVRDWFLGKKKKNKFYVVKANNTSPRSATFTDAESALIKYNSEYHYIYSQLHSLKNKTTLETDDYFLAANLSRKLLEAFLSFKFPWHRGNFGNLIDFAASTCKNLQDERKDKIRKFINVYSHNNLIEPNGDFMETLIGECATVILDIFDWIKELDETHYEEMEMIAVHKRLPWLCKLPQKVDSS